MFSSSHHPFPPARRSYVPVSSTDEFGATATSASASALGDNNRVGLSSHDHHEVPRHVPSAYHHIEQARNLTWTDAFYDGKPGIIAAFDRDAKRAGSWLMWRFLRTAILLWSMSIMYWILGVVDLRVNHDEEESIVDDIFGVYTLILGAFVAVMALRGRQAMLSQHVAITSEGIRVDNGTMVTVTIPFEHVQKVDVKPYRFCCQTYEGQFAVTVQRAAAPLEQVCCQKTKALELYGLMQPQQFADLVLAMKDAQDQGTYEGMEEGSLGGDRRLELRPMPASTLTTTDDDDSL